MCLGILKLPETSHTEPPLTLFLYFMCPTNIFYICEWNVIKLCFMFLKVSWTSYIVDLLL
jgi:hypothetical protein